MDFYWSDPHLYHGNILKYSRRVAFMTEKEKELLESNPSFRVSDESIRRMNKALLDNLNAQVGKKDRLFILGDIFFSPEHLVFNRAQEIRDSIKCEEVHFIIGNHDVDDLCEEIHSDKRLTKFSHMFNSVAHSKMVRYKGQLIWLSHYAHACWPKAKRSWHLYGHSHASFENWRELHFPEAKCFDVGVDARWRLLGNKGSAPASAYGPWSFEEVNSVMNKRKGYAPDHHGYRGN